MTTFFYPSSKSREVELRLSVGTNRNISVKKVFLGYQISLDGKSLFTESEDNINNIDNIEKRLRTYLFNELSDIEKQRIEIEKEIPRIKTISKRNKRLILKKNKKARLEKRITRRRYTMKQRALYGSVLVEDIYAEARIRRVTVDHIIPLMGVDASGKWVISGLQVPNNLQLMGYEENNRKANKVNLSEINKTKSLDIPNINTRL